jgi:GNAT superfamily N-acetyltransferase
MKDIQILVFDSGNGAHRTAFSALNRAWLERYFAVEAHDLEQLDDPQEFILKNGGRIFLAAEESGEIIGTVALIATAPGEFEMAKMSVSEHRQGYGVGRRLCHEAIHWARSVGAKRIWLESNRRLKPALALYESVGFWEIPLSPSPYARADIKMELPL